MEQNSEMDEGIDVEFTNVSYTINVWDPLVTRKLRSGTLLHNSILNLPSYFAILIFFLEKKTILDNVSGSFCKNQVGAIIGCSGSGKSTLMSILSGYT